MIHEVHYETFALDEEQRFNLYAALSRAAELAGTRSTLPKSALLDLIVLDFLATNDFGLRGDTEFIQRYLPRLETALNVKLVAVDPKANIVFGLDTVVSLAGVEDE